MFEWKVEEQKLCKEKHIEKDKIVNMFNRTVYDCEATVSREDKIQFVNKMQDGKLSYILNLAKKFANDKSSLPHDLSGKVKTVSLKAWLRRNDEQHIVDTNYDYGFVGFLNVQRNIHDLNKPTHVDTYNDYIDEMFHQQLKACEEAEREYFVKHDEYSILKSQFRDWNRTYYTTFGVPIIDSSNGDLYIGDFENCREITIEELKELISKYEQVEAFVDKLTKETHIQ